MSSYSYFYHVSAQREMELDNKFSELCPPLSVKFGFKPRFWMAFEFSNAGGY